MNKEQFINNLKLCLITDSQRTRLPIREAVEEALKGGVSAVQLREKNPSSKKELYKLASDLRELTLKYNSSLIINTHIDLMLDVKADGIHLGHQSLDLMTVKNLIKDKPYFIGVSTHNQEEAKNAADLGADYITLSPIYRTKSKPDADLLGLDKFEQICKSINIPVIGLGGIKSENVKDVIEAGAYGVAMIGEILENENPFLKAKEINKILSLLGIKFDR